MSAWHAGPVLVLQDKSLDIVCHLDAKNTFFLGGFFFSIEERLFMLLNLVFWCSALAGILFLVGSLLLSTNLLDSTVNTTWH